MVQSGGSGSNGAESAIKPLTHKKSGELADRRIKGYTLIRSGCSTLAASVQQATLDRKHVAQRFVGTMFEVPGGAPVHYGFRIFLAASFRAGLPNALSR